jgi:hypothetical protein
MKRIILGWLAAIALTAGGTNVMAQATPASPASADAPTIDFSRITSPIIFRGDATTAYRNPAAIYNNGWIYLYFTLTKIDPDGKAYQCTAWSKSRDLITWTTPKIFTPKDRNLNFGSPGDVVRFGNDWVLTLQTYPRPNGEKHGNKDSRVWIMRSQDLENWGPPELLAVKGPGVSREKMGRMIDPFLLQDKDDPKKWWCFYKQGGQLHASSSNDLVTWTPTDFKIAGGENPCVIVDGNQYVLFYAPPNGVGVKRSDDLKTWTDEGVQTLGQAGWPWTQGRLTAAFALDLRQNPKIGKVLLFFHGSDYPEEDPRGGFDNFSSLGLAWGTDLKTWSWPGQSP